jgi:superfamily I DNA/RNA helicase
MGEESEEKFMSPTLVLAGPGAGKTYLLAKKIKHLIDKGVDKKTIAVLTFGVEASQHMKDELTNPDGDFKIKNEDLPHISTMHSLGLEIVKEKPSDVKLLKTNLEVQENEDVKKLMYRDAAYILGLPG